MEAKVKRRRWEEKQEVGGGAGEGGTGSCGRRNRKLGKEKQEVGEGGTGSWGRRNRKLGKE